MSQETYAVDLDNPKARLSELVGSKAANLAFMIGKGIQVPSGFVVTTEGYKETISKTESQTAISDLLKGIDYDDPDSIERIADEIRGIVEALQIPESVSSSIINAYDRSGSGPVAVRSSGTAEDLPDASFAGQYETYLNVEGTDNVLDCIRKCYASLWTDRAISYRNANGIQHDTVHIAVLIQSMIPARSAGVMFTQSPLSTVGKEIMIESNFGLGESVVNGSAIPDRYVVRRTDKNRVTMVSKEIGTKNVVVESSSSGFGVEASEVNGGRSEASSLEDQEVLKLARIGMEIESIFNSPQDVEWALDKDGDIHILQSRPITTATTKSKDDTKEILWSRGYADDYWNDNVTPLFFDLLGDQITYIVNIELNEIMGYKGMSDELLKLHQAHVYFNLDVIKNKVVNEMPPFVRSEDVLFYFPEGGGPYGKDTMRALPFALKNRIMAELRVMLLDPDGSITKTSGKYEEWTSAVFLPYLQDFDSKLKQLETLGSLSQFMELADELDKVMMRHFRMVRYGIPVHNLGMSLISAYLLRTFLGEYEATTYFPILISGLQHKTTETNDAINALAGMARMNPDIKHVIESTSSNSTLKKLKELHGSDTKEFLNRFHSFLEEYGVRGYTREPYYPRWKDEPALVFDILRPLMEEKRTSVTLIKELETLKRKTENEVKERIKFQRFGGLKWALFSAILGFSRTYLIFRENQRFNLDRWITRNRDLYLQIGRHLTDIGLIAEPSHIFFLYRKEIKKLIAGKLSDSQKDQLSLLCEERYKEFKKYEDTVPPKFLQGSREYNDPLPISNADGVLHGIPASQGEASGTVRVLASIHDIPKVRAGEIIVVPRTDPGWTPVFSKIEGLITETGGVLSHGAVVSREYGIPAVTNIRNACQTLATGDYVTINGNDGSVRFNRDRE